MKLKLWQVWRYFSAGRKYLNLTTALSIFGMALGVGSLVVSMVVVSSYLTTLKSTVIDAYGDMMILHDSARLENIEKIIDKVNEVDNSIVAYTPYLSVEAIFARNAKVSGVIVQGFDLSTVGEVLKMEKHLIKGEFDLSSSEAELPGIFIGKRLAENYNVKMGDVINLVVPVAQTRGGNAWRPKLGKFKVRGVLFFGRYDYDTKYLVADIRDVQKFSGLKSKITGLRVKLKDSDKAVGLSDKINEQLGNEGYWTVSWRSLNYNLFSAADYEKYIIFLVLLIIVIAACFTISSTLYVHVMRRFQDISILKAMGASPRFIRQIFSMQGLLLGLMGYILGVGIGLGACYLFSYGITHWGLLGAKVYKLDGLDLDIKSIDLIQIFVVSLFICFLSTLAPARRGAKLMPAEGLKYE